MKEIIIVILTFLFTSAFAADFTIHVNNTSINWTRGIITSAGKASILHDDNGVPVKNEEIRKISINRARIITYERAKEYAIENLVLSIRSIRVSPDKHMTDLIKEDVFTSKKLTDAVNHALKVRIYPIDFFTSRCEVTMNLGDIIASLPYKFPALDFPERNDNSISTKYSSLIVDCRNIGVKPMLFPSIYTEDGLEIYSRNFVDSRYAVENGIASYCHNEEEAMKMFKAGDRPYFTVAIKSLNNCPVISERDTKKIFSSRDTINNLKKCNVIIIL